MSFKQTIIDDVLGMNVPSLFNDTLLQTLKFKPYTESNKTETYDSMLCQEIAFLMPQDAMLGALERNATLGLILHLTSAPSYYFYLKPKWNFLADIMPQDSIFHVVMYLNKNNEVCVCFFDMLLFFGIAQRDINILERQQKLHTYISTYHKDKLNTYHWVGYAETCFNLVKQPKQTHAIPFEVGHIAILTQNSDVLRKVITPLIIPM